MSKKGFTLIELLGVIVILSLLMTLAMPKIINSVKNSNSKIDSDTYKLINSAVDLYIENNKSVFRKIPGNTFCIPVSDLVNSGYLKGPVTLSESDLDISESKQVKVVYRDGFNYEVVDNNIIDNNNHDNDVINCKPIQTYTPAFAVDDSNAVEGYTVTAGNVPQGNFELGDEYVIYVNDTTSYHFYILSDNEDGTVNMIMDRNICNDGTVNYTSQNNYCRYAWHAGANNNNYGPDTAMEELYEGTKEWINVPVIEINYLDEANGTEADKGYTSLVVSNGVGIITGKPTTNTTTIGTTSEPIRARLPKYNEVNEAGCTDSEGSCPVWLIENMTYYNTSNDKYSMNNNSEAYQYQIYSYWVLSSFPGYSAGALHVYHYGLVTSSDTIGGSHGARPVITIPKDYLK